jgi:hypothetical protein
VRDERTSHRDHINLDYKKKIERNVKRELGKALSLLNAYALGPCSAGSGVCLTVSNQSEKGYVTSPFFLLIFEVLTK